MMRNILFSLLVFITSLPLAAQQTRTANSEEQEQWNEQTLQNWLSVATQVHEHLASLPQASEYQSILTDISDDLHKIETYQDQITTIINKIDPDNINVNPWQTPSHLTAGIAETLEDYIYRLTYYQTDYDQYFLGVHDYVNLQKSELQAIAINYRNKASLTPAAQQRLYDRLQSVMISQIEILTTKSRAIGSDFRAANSESVTAYLLWKQKIQAKSRTYKKPER